MWFQSFNYFIHKIDYEFILKEYAKDILPEEIGTNYVVGEAQPNETIYISYFINTSDQNIEQHTVKCSEEGIFIDKILVALLKILCRILLIVKVWWT